MLTLNQQAASLSLSGAPAQLHLLPRQTYLNVDEEAASTLERKRNFIYCLIVRIMKQEKEMHIDNLVFKVSGATCRTRLKLQEEESPHAVPLSGSGLLSEAGLVCRRRPVQLQHRRRPLLHHARHQ